MAKLVIVLMASALFVVAMVTIALNLPDHAGGVTESTAIPNVPPVKVSAFGLWIDYKNNEVAADAKYNGKAVLVTGNAVAVKKDDLDDDYYVKLTVGNEFESVNAYLDRSALSQAGQIRGSSGWWGQESIVGAEVVTLLCVGAGRDDFGSALLRHCTITANPPKKMPEPKPQEDLRKTHPEYFKFNKDEYPDADDDSQPQEQSKPQEQAKPQEQTIPQ